MYHVALRKESVDRNGELCCLIIKIRFVALRKESVDRNNTMQVKIVKVNASLSARRAWIEIKTDRYKIEALLSLSARRAWIEILAFSHLWDNINVALRKESVDRNTTSTTLTACSPSRSPQGERG